MFDVELHVRLGQRRFGIRFLSGLDEGEVNEHKPAMYGRAKQQMKKTWYDGQNGKGKKNWEKQRTDENIPNLKRSFLYYYVKI